MKGTKKKAKASQKKKKPKPKKKASPKAKNKSAKKVHANPETEGTAYKAGEYSKLRKAFIAAKKEDGYTYSEANESWKTSGQRAEILAGMTESERKRRRF